MKSPSDTPSDTPKTMAEIKQLSRPRHQLQPDTVQAVSEFKAGRTWRQVATLLGYQESYAPTLRNVAAGLAGSLTPVTEAILRRRLGLSELPPTQEVTACPSCFARGELRVHAAPDCHGYPVEAVVALAPGETVRKVRPARSSPPAWKSIALRAKTTERLREAAKADGLRLSAFVEYLLTLHILQQQGRRG